MSTLYLIRHCQVGTRDNYDLLSEVGRQQAQLLGVHLAAQRVGWRALYAGGLRRPHRSPVSRSMRQGKQLPELIIDEQWSEFSLADVYWGLTPRLLAKSSTFTDDYEERQADLATDQHETARRWAL